MTTKIETYGNFNIAYDEDASQFVATHEKDKTVSPMRSKELKPLRTRIDNFNDPQEKKKREQPKQKALQIGENYTEEGYEIKEVMVGAFGKVLHRWGGGYTLFVWVSSRSGYGRKRIEVDTTISGSYRSGFFAEDTKENRDTVKAMQKVMEEKQAFIKKKDEELEKLERKITRVKPQIEELPEWEQ